MLTFIRIANLASTPALIRDGASLDTLKQYVRSSQYTILVIETDKGEVFGSFSSSPWRNHFGFFGGPPAFVWKMRQSRQTWCPSLYEQAKLESTIDVYPYSGKTSSVQVCQHDLLAVGGDDSVDENLIGVPSTGRSNGFAFALQSDLLRGTTSPCSSFQSPALCGEGEASSVFCTSGLEVWTLTPCRDVDAAEKLEMAKYFVEESSRSIQSSSPTLGSRRVSYTCGSSDLYSQKKFFRRIGENNDREERRQSWHNPSDLNCDVGSSLYRGLLFAPK
jgi:TLD